eukprot:s445_g25.t1
MSWANPVVASLALGDVVPGKMKGLVLNCSWPMPREVQDAYDNFRERLKDAMPKEAYIYPSSTLHCTICTFRAFTAGPLEDEGAIGRWCSVLEKAKASEHWPKGSFRLKMGRPTLEGSAGIFRFEDLDGSIAAMRQALREAIVAQGGQAAEGIDWSKAKTLPGTPEGEAKPHLPDIVHSTVLRWTAEPSSREEAMEIFRKISETWEPMEVVVTVAKAVLEDIPYMHIPDDKAHVWWRWDAPDAP